MKLLNGNLKVLCNTGKVKVIKVDSESKEKLSGVEFELKRNGTEEVYKGVTNDNGEIIFDKLYPGKYTIVETKAREEYKINKKVFEVNVDFNSQAEVTVENDIIKGYLRIIKQDFENEDVRLKRSSI